MNIVLPQGQCNKPMKFGHMYFHSLKGWLKGYTCKDGHSNKVGQFVAPKWCREEVA